MSAKSSFRDAVLEDGRYVLYQVTTRLYEGGDLRPDVYFKRNSSLRYKDYNGIFNRDQRATIEYSGMPEDYDIKSDARIFDVSIHALLAEHMCGLKTHESLYQKVKQVKNKRNEVAHPDQPISLGYQAQGCMEGYSPSIVITDENLNANLEKLLNLYNDIIEDLEEKTAEHLFLVKMEIGQRINKKKLQSHMPARMHRREERQSESDEMPTWGKVAVGTAIGVGALALVGALASSSIEDRKKEEKKRNQTGANRGEQECVVM